MDTKLCFCFGQIRRTAKTLRNNKQKRLLVNHTTNLIPCDLVLHDVIIYVLNIITNQKRLWLISLLNQFQTKLYANQSCISSTYDFHIEYLKWAKSVMNQYYILLSYSISPTLKYMQIKSTIHKLRSNIMNLLP